VEDDGFVVGQIGDVCGDDGCDAVLPCGVSLVDPADEIGWQFNDACDGVLTVSSWSSEWVAVWVFGSAFHWFCSFAS
jgi:hypothetical protein